VLEKDATDGHNQPGTDGANPFTRCVPNTRVCALVLSNHTYLQTDELHILVNTDVVVTNLDQLFSHIFKFSTRTRGASQHRQLPRGPQTQRNRTTSSAPLHVLKLRVQRTRSVLLPAARRVRCLARMTLLQASCESRSWHPDALHIAKIGYTWARSIFIFFFRASLYTLFAHLYSFVCFIFFVLSHYGTVLWSRLARCIYPLSLTLVLVLYAALVVINIWYQKSIRRGADLSDRPLRKGWFDPQTYVTTALMQSTFS
jgi:hypothetical protein